MKVILTDNVKTLGNVGEIVNVSPGYARNYLFKNSLATLADEGNKKQLADKQKMLAKKIGEQKVAAEAIKSSVEKVTLTFIKKVGASGKLFGTVTNSEISKALAEQDIDIARRMIIIEDPIKSVGSFGVKAKIFEGVEANFKVNVEMDPKQIEENKKKAEAIAKAKLQAAADKLAAEKAEAENPSTDADAESTEESAE